nr:hypothetical protein [uncultured Desulfobulbus sp.]
MLPERLTIYYSDLKNRPLIQKMRTEGLYDRHRSGQPKKLIDAKAKVVLRMTVECIPHEGLASWLQKLTKLQNGRFSRPGPLHLPEDIYFHGILGHNSTHKTVEVKI